MDKGEGGGGAEGLNKLLFIKFLRFRRNLHQNLHLLLQPFFFFEGRAKLRFKMPLPAVPFPRHNLKKMNKQNRRKDDENNGGKNTTTTFKKMVYKGRLFSPFLNFQSIDVKSFGYN